MRFFLICDNDDVAVGMRLAGVESFKTNDSGEVARLLGELSRDENTGIILINHSLGVKCAGIITDFRKKNTVPVIVEIPDADSDSSVSSVSDYVREAIGINI